MEGTAEGSGYCLSCILLFAQGEGEGEGRGLVGSRTSGWVRPVKPFQSVAVKSGGWLVGMTSAPGARAGWSRTRTGTRWSR